MIMRSSTTGKLPGTPKVTGQSHRFACGTSHNPELTYLRLWKAFHNRNTLFYKTEKGAHVADVHLSLSYTCELCGADPFDYLTDLQRHAQDVAAPPACWMPWNYRQTLAAVPAATDPPATPTPTFVATVP